MKSDALGSNVHEAKEHPYLQTILDFIEDVYQQEKEAILKTDMPGHATTANILGLVKKELCRCKEITWQQEPCGVDRETLEQAMRPFCSLALILRRAENVVDIDAGDMAEVLGALVHSAWARTGYPRLGDVL